MNLVRVKAIVKKEFIQVLRDPTSLGMAIAIPMLLLIIFGYALNTDVEHVKLIVWDQNETPTSRDFILRIKNSRYFKIVKFCNGYKPIERAINRDKIYMGLIIHKDFSKDKESGRRPYVQLLVDGTDSSTATVAKGYIETIVSTYNTQCIVQAFNQQGLIYNVPVDVRTRIWFNENLQSKNFIIPGLIAVIMMVIAALLTSLTIAKEWDRGTMEQLISTPIQGSELIVGKCIPYFVIAVLDVLIAMAMGQFVFHVPFRGNVLLLIILGCLFLVGVLFMGILISVTMKNQFMATQMAFMTTFLPSFLLSGFAFPILNMPVQIQYVTNFVPAKYFIIITKSIYLKGIGARLVIPEILYLIGFSALMVGLARVSFQKKVI